MLWIIRSVPILPNLSGPAAVCRSVILCLRETGLRGEQATEEHEERRGTPPGHLHVVLHYCVASEAVLAFLTELFLSSPFLTSADVG